MSTPNRPAARAGGRLWAFSLAVYGKPEVAAACLRLQEARGLDVNLLLHALWCGSLGYRITLPERRQLDQTVAEWHEEAVRGLRRVRQWLKTQTVVSGPAAETFRQGVKAQELEAERLEQMLLEGLLTPPVRPGGPAHAAVNLLGLVPNPKAPERDDLVALLRGAWPETTEADLRRLFARPSGSFAGNQP